MSDEHLGKRDSTRKLLGDPQELPRSDGGGASLHPWGPGPLVQGWKSAPAPSGSLALPSAGPSSRQVQREEPRLPRDSSAHSQTLRSRGPWRWRRPRWSGPGCTAPAEPGTLPEGMQGKQVCDPPSHQLSAGAYGALPRTRRLRSRLGGEVDPDKPRPPGLLAGTDRQRPP